jgi:hypothetical protein
MKLWQSRAVASESCDRSLRHEFLIGPLCNTSLVQEKARLYYCTRCKWSFLVCGSKVAVLDEDGSPLVGEDGLRRFKTFEEGSVPGTRSLRLGCIIRRRSVPALLQEEMRRTWPSGFPPRSHWVWPPSAFATRSYSDARRFSEVAVIYLTAVVTALTFAYPSRDRDHCSACRAIRHAPTFAAKIHDHGKGVS